MKALKFQRLRGFRLSWGSRGVNTKFEYSFIRVDPDPCSLNQ